MAWIAPTVPPCCGLTAPTRSGSPGPHPVWPWAPLIHLVTAVAQAVAFNRTVQSIWWCSTAEFSSFTPGYQCCSVHIWGQRWQWNLKTWFTCTVCVCVRNSECSSWGCTERETSWVQLGEDSCSQAFLRMWNVMRTLIKELFIFLFEATLQFLTLGNCRGNTLTVRRSALNWWGLSN